MNDVAGAVVEKPTYVRFLVLGWLCLFAALAYIHRSCLAVPAESIRVELRMDRSEMAQVLAAFLLSYSVFQLPGGWLGDRWGSRRTITVLVLLWSAATGWMGLAGGFLGLYLSRFVNGAAQAGIFPCSVNTVSRWFPASGRAFPNGMLGGFMSAGGVIGTSFTSLLLWYFDGDWSFIFQLLAAPGFVAAILFFFWFRDRPQEHSWVNRGELEKIAGTTDLPRDDATESRGPTPWLTMFTSVPLLLVCGQQFCRAAGYIFYLTWFPTFLQSARRMSVVGSGFYTSLALMGVVIGSPLGGLLIDWLLKTTRNPRLSRQGVAVVSLVICGLFFTAAFFVTDPLLTVILLACGSLGAGICGPAGYTITIDMGGKHVGTVFSVMNTAGNMGAFVMILLVDRFVDWRGWNEVLLLLAGLYFLGALCWSLVVVKGSIFKEHGGKI